MKINFRALFILYTVLILIALSIPGRTVSTPHIVGIDKVIHFSMFALWALLYCRVTGVNKTNSFKILAVGILFSALTELYQHLLIPNRIGDIFDFLANILGISLTLVYLNFNKNRD